MEFLFKLFDTSDFPQRWNCGTWTDFHGWLHIVSDLAVFGSYMAIPAVIIFFVLRKDEVQFPKLFWLFCAFIFTCGFVHLIEAAIFWTPIYRISAVVKFLTAIFSWATVVALVQVAPKAILLPTLNSLNAKLSEQNRNLEIAQAELAHALAESDRSKSLLDATFKSASSGIVISDLEANYVLINPAGRKLMANICDVPPADWNETIGLFENEEGPALPERVLPLFKACHGEASDGVELLMRNGVDAPIWVTTNATQILNKKNEPIGAVAVFDDITDQKKSEAGLRDLQQQTASKLVASNRQLDEVLNTIPQAIWRGSLGENGFTFSYFSPGIEKIIGLEPDELTRDIETWVNRIHDQDRDSIKKTIEKVVSGELDELEIEYRVQHVDESYRWIRNRLQAQTIDEKRVVQGIMADITKERDNNLALIRAERLASIGTLAAGIAHEINNPLGAMMLTTDRGKSQIDLGDFSKEKVGETFDEIMKQIERCSKIVSGVLKFASNESTERNAGSLLPIASDSKNLILFKAKRKNVTIEIDNGEVEPIANINETEIGQVFVNLLANAIDASPVDAKVKLAIRTEDRRVVCSVIDHGKGMDSKTKQLAFDPFYTSKRNYGGTGLGLSLSHTIITKHGGEIWIDDTTNEKGTTISFWLPRIVD